MNREPYFLAVASHKGGTGRTTTALALAWLWGAQGRRVALLDADPIQAAALVAARADGCPWAGVRLLRGLPAADGALADCDVVVADCPSLTESAAAPVLRRADGIVLTCLAEVYCVRTLPVAVRAIAAARQDNPRLELLGVLPGVYRADPLSAVLLGELRAGQRDLLLEPPIPFHTAVRDWAMTPGGPLPAGPAADAFARVAAVLSPLTACAAA